MKLQVVWLSWGLVDLYGEWGLYTPQENRSITKEKYKKKTYARYDEPVSYHQRR